MIINGSFQETAKNINFKKKKNMLIITADLEISKNNHNNNQTIEYKG